MAIVSLSSPRKLKVCHFKKSSEICNYSYPNTILAVKLNRAVSVKSESQDFKNDNGLCFRLLVVAVGLFLFIFLNRYFNCILLLKLYVFFFLHV